MNKTTEALKLAEEALAGGLWDYGPGQDEHKKCEEVLAIIREALAEPNTKAGKLHAMKTELWKDEPVQEPVAWIWQSVDIESRSIETGLLFNRGADDENTDWTPLYAAPVSAPEQEPVKQEPVADKVLRLLEPFMPVDAKAIRAEALEEAAKECDEWANVKPVSDFSHGSAAGAKNCADAIRGLK